MAKINCQYNNRSIVAVLNEQQSSNRYPQHTETGNKEVGDRNPEL